MKKFIYGISGILPYLMVSRAYAQTTWENFVPPNVFKFTDLASMVQTIIMWLLIFAGVIAVIYIIWGGYTYITAGGDAEKATAGRTTLINAIIGLVIMFAAYAIVIWLGGILAQ